MRDRRPASTAVKLPTAPPGYLLCKVERCPVTGYAVKAVAWWSELPLDECVEGRERLVSVYQANDGTGGQAGCWSEWFPESRVSGRSVSALSDWFARNRLAKGDESWGGRH